MSESRGAQSSRYLVNFEKRLWAHECGFQLGIVGDYLGADNKLRCLGQLAPAELQIYIDFDIVLVLRGVCHWSLPSRPRASVQ